MSDEKLERLQSSLNGIGRLNVDLNRSLNEVVSLFQSVNHAPQGDNSGNSNTNSGNEPSSTSSDKK